MKNYIIQIPSIAILALILFTSCSKQSTSEHVEDEHDEHSEGLIELTNDQVDQVGIKTGTFTNESLGDNIVANGTIELPPNNLASISVPMEGFVEDIKFLEGAAVKKGQTLVSLKHPSYIQLQQDYLQAVSRLLYLEQNLARQKTLTEAKVSAEKTLQKSQSEFNITRAEVNGLKEKLRFLGISSDKVLQGDIQSSIYLTAPFSGTVTELNVHKGELVTPHDVIMEVIDREHMHVELQVFQQNIPKVKEGQKIVFTIPAFKNGAQYEGEVSLVGKSLDLNSKTIRVHGHFEEQKFLIPGLYVEANIVAESRTRRALPEDAVIRDEGKSFFFILSGKEGEHQIFKKIEVAIGISEMGFTEILNFGEQIDTTKIVTEGAFYLKSEMNKEKGGHQH